jgi:hypothetical protein
MKKSRNKNRIGRVALGVVQKFAPNVTTVTDADDDLLINVTERDYKTSVKKEHSGCALAVATKRQEEAAKVIVSASTAYVIKGNHATRYRVPQSASREIVSFDRGAEFCTGDYKLKAIAPSGRLGKSHPVDTRDRNRPSTGNLPKRFFHHTANIRDGLKAKA